MRKKSIESFDQDVDIYETRELHEIEIGSEGRGTDYPVISDDPQAALDRFHKDIDEMLKPRSRRGRRLWWLYNRN